MAIYVSCVVEAGLVKLAIGFELEQGEKRTRLLLESVQVIRRGVEKKEN